MGASLVVACLLPVLRSADVCTDGAVCSSSSRSAPDGDRPCSEVLEVLAPGEPSLWTRTTPAVIRQAVQSTGWDLVAFSHQGLSSRFGSSRLKVFSPAQAALLDGQTSRMHTLRHIVAKLDDARQKIYVFDNQFFQNISAKELAPIPEWLKMDSADKFLTMGGPLAGTQFHSHGPAFLLLASGTKRWYMHAPGHFPNITARELHRPVSTFETDILPNLDSPPLTCVQTAGDAIFVPDGWSHATINVESTLGVAWQRTVSSSDICVHGFDYWCLYKSLISAERLSPKKQPARYKELFQQAEEVTGGFPVGFLRHLTPYWQVSADAKEVFKSVRGKVMKFLKAAQAHSDEAILATALLKRLADVLFTVKKDAKRASDLLAAGLRKAPEAGVGVSLAQLLGKQQRWKEASEALVLHLSHFPDDDSAAMMLDQAKTFASQT
ncbi:JmjC domain-containing protein 8 [Symbiodinium microadriaticum]|uniref:JmjC domain-containing protein 8 n=1 Tax=Symbiodinium microadriaticum TaxID=2951 RepID=A0A1Q9ELG7_SYMMI|nr:JmjC domain-containing protein 8 [Symbiodinium microadriaticum]